MLDACLFNQRGHLLQVVGSESEAVLHVESSWVPYEAESQQERTNYDLVDPPNKLVIKEVQNGKRRASHHAEARR